MKRKRSPKERKGLIPKGLKKTPQRPMPADPKDLARAMFAQADRKMFGNVKAPLPKNVKKTAPLAN